MRTFAVGDVHGHARTLRALLGAAGFREGRDRLWSVGDLVNRGPESAEVLRFFAGLGDRAVTVLGNHDLHLIGRRLGLRDRRKDDTFEDVLDAADGDALVAWLRGRPFVHREAGWLMVHAGLLPMWSADDAQREADEAQAAMATDELRRLVVPRAPAGDGLWCPELAPVLRRRLAVDAMTRMRVVYPDGRMRLAFTGPPAESPAGTKPWFAIEGRKTATTDVLFGHWASLGLHVDDQLYGLDSGCAWGGALTCLRLDDRKLFQVPNSETR